MCLPRLSCPPSKEVSSAIRKNPDWFSSRDSFIMQPRKLVKNAYLCTQDWLRPLLFIEPRRLEVILRRRFSFNHFRPNSSVFKIIGTFVGQESYMQKSNLLNINRLDFPSVPRTGLEPVQPFRPRDFKSLVSTIPPPRPGRCLNRQAPRERKYSYFPGFPTIWRHGNRWIPRSARRPWRTSLRPR